MLSKVASEEESKVSGGGRFPSDILIAKVDQNRTKTEHKIKAKTPRASKHNIRSHHSCPSVIVLLFYSNAGIIYILLSMYSGLSLFSLS